ncbi:Hypothetical protein PHPALM_12005 [Phytophthora palmivora]|uniref:Uncharacterized protein n=1 Tax=Phytophthora palmivora TaxID=4796 RepID=A0A2P4Y0U5_9STRA|nr:Hypothetical protein PHPALM_12005 [Phytophthora palmivora]
MITGSESDEDTTGSTKDPTLTQDTPSQDGPVDDSESSEAEMALTSSPAKNITLDEARCPWLFYFRSFHPKGYRSLVDYRSDEAEEEGAVTELQEFSNDLDEQQERYQAAQLQGAPAPPTPVYPRGYYPPDAGSGSPMFLEHLKPLVVLTMGALLAAPMSVPRFKMNHSLSMALRPLGVCCLHHTEFLEGIHKSPEETGRPLWPLPRVGVPLGTAREHHNPDPGRRPVLEMGFSEELYSSGVKNSGKIVCCPMSWTSAIVALRLPM